MNRTLADLIDHHLATLRTRRGTDALRLLETGSIRSSQIRFRDGDGWSTVALATHAKVYGGSALSIDLDTTVASQVVASHGLFDHVTLWEKHSIDAMSDLVYDHEEFDLILLDSDNDAQLILHEWFLAKKLIRKGGIIMIDDVEPGSKEVLKGNDVIPHFNLHKVPYKIYQRSKNNIRTGVAVIEF